MADENEVLLPYRYYPDPAKGRPVFNGFIYIGVPDTDPEIPSNQLQVRAYQESGASVLIAQPVRTGGGGVPLLNGSPVQLQVEGEYSIKVLDHLGAQVYYAPSLIAGVRPATIVRAQFVPLDFDLPNRFINSYLFDSNTTAIDYYNTYQPLLDFGALGIAPFNIENIPEFRFDLAGESVATIDLGGLS
jgi:hypothetical protein